MSASPLLHRRLSNSLNVNVSIRNCLIPVPVSRHIRVPGYRHNVLLSRPLAPFRGHCRLRSQSLARTWPEIKDLLVPTKPLQLVGCERFGRSAAFAANAGSEIPLESSASLVGRTCWPHETEPERRQWLRSLSQPTPETIPGVFSVHVFDDARLPGCARPNVAARLAANGGVGRSLAAANQKKAS
jgi:hypothetical protein